MTRDRVAEEAEADAVAREVLAGTDAIEVPAELLTPEADSSSAPRPPEIIETLYIRVQKMSVAEKVKLALRGNKDARILLIRNPNRMVMRMVLQNPRITEEEILNLAKNRNIDDEVLRIIGGNRDWTATYAVRLALVENPKTPIPLALRFLSTLQVREIRGLAKSKNVPAVISTQARRVLFSREGGSGARH